MTTNEEERSKSGEKILRYQANNTKKTRVIGANEFTTAIEGHIEKNLGKVSTVLHELVSEIVHVDIEVIVPTTQRSFYLLVTNGMSALPMNTPKNAQDKKYAELVLSLPSNWPMTQEDLKDERYNWPVQLLRELARFPHQYNTWLWVGHTVPNGNPIKSFAVNTKLCCALILIPILVPESFRVFEASKDVTVHFLSLFPIYKEEMNFKLTSGVEPLYSLFEKNRITELLDINRKNVCRKGLFQR